MSYRKGMRNGWVVERFAVDVACDDVDSAFGLGKFGERIYWTCPQAPPPGVLMRRLSPALREGLAVGGKVSTEPSWRRMVWDPVFPGWPSAALRGG